MRPKVYSVGYLRGLVERAGFPDVWMQDEEYVLPTRDCIPEQGELLGEWLGQLPIRVQRNVFDCNKFGLVGAGYLSISHGVFYRDGEQASALGWFTGATATELHVGVIGIHPPEAGQAEPQVCLYEPQPPKYLRPCEGISKFYLASF